MGERRGTADSDIPAAIEGFDEDEATMMWSREEIEAGGKLRAPALPDLPDLPDLDPPPLPTPVPGRPAFSPPRAPGGGLDENALFSDVFANEAPTSARPVHPTFDDLGAPSIRVTPSAAELEAESQRPSMPSLTAPPRASRRGLWIALSVLAVMAGLAAAGFMFRQPLAAQLQAMGMRLPF